MCEREVIGVELILENREHWRSVDYKDAANRHLKLRERNVPDRSAACFLASQVYVFRIDLTVVLDFSVDQLCDLLA